MDDISKKIVQQLSCTDHNHVLSHLLKTNFSPFYKKGRVREEVGTCARVPDGDGAWVELVWERGNFC
jgi:hypothetical protein